MPAPLPDSGLEITLLGGFDARLKGHPVSGIHNKMRALLAYLVVEREQEVSREFLAELLWRDNEPSAARENLRRNLFNLRQLLELPSGATLFASGKHTVRFIPGVTIDVLDFMPATPSCNKAHPPDTCNPCLAQMERMAGLYRGEFMAGLALPDCPDFEDWLNLQRETLHRRALALLEKLSNCHEHMHGYGKALQFALRHAELEPWDEMAHRRVMRLYALNGQNRAALAQYEACCRTLKRELNALPSAETRQLAEHIGNGGLSKQHEQDNAGRASARQAGLQPGLQLDRTERRQVTVLYCDLTATEVDDPDEIMELLHAPQARCTDIIRQFSGHIVQMHGGGLLAYFGYPQADEHAALHAVQAALAVTREAAQGIEIRAGVHTGLIVTGGDASMPDTSGKTSRLAIQVRLGVLHNEVAISPVTHSMVSGYFDCISLGAHSLPGVAGTWEIFRVARENGVRTRLDAATQLTPWVGRKAELAKLMTRWKKAAHGAPQVVLVQGEAGIGKSRLLRTLMEKLAGQPHAVRESRCFPEFCQSPFHPLIAMLEAILDFDQGDAPAQKFSKLARYVEAHYPAAPQDTVPVLAQLLSVPLTAPYSAPPWSPQKLKEQTIAVLLNLIQALAAKQPVLLIIEDLHWIDPSSLELLTRFVEQKNSGAILTLLTARPEFSPPWEDGLYTTLPLAHLGEKEAAEIVTSISAQLAPTTLRRIVERADGVPLFVEEIAKVATQDKQASIPASLHDLLAARMDKLGEAKSTAQLAAAIGREFDLDLLRKVSSCDSTTLTHLLHVLLDAGLILKSATPIPPSNSPLEGGRAYTPSP